MTASAERPRGRDRRRELLQELRDAGAPLGVAELAGRLGVHPNTVRFHLDALVNEGTVQPATEETPGPGRPRTVYTPRPGLDRGGSRGFRLLAEMLLGRLAAAEPDLESAVATGRVWGRHLIGTKPRSPNRPTAEEAAERLTGLLDRLGFEPEAGPPGSAGPLHLRLRRCPFLELAEEYPELICPMHLGLMQGALSELDAPISADRLDPFAATDACIAQLRLTPAAAPS